MMQHQPNETGKLTKEAPMSLLDLCAKLLLLLSKDDGQDLIEYALVVALIALGATAGMSSLAADINNAFNAIGSTLSTRV
jgi:pilus assembly protein Flp/PilA